MESFANYNNSFVAGPKNSIWQQVKILLKSVTAGLNTKITLEKARGMEDQKEEVKIQTRPHP